ncbi:isochorismatase family protein [Modestobacter sp. I12A-02628]|uniref:Isochorismatase family protein n=2 Tax=Goekera deserti TaxID=2497753 RepID=A0A7K3W9Z6_9ACTN|nr:isochorismatase family protein [Goekera deserti]NDI47464.1 isochorismatase family protein [Goekera deserti]NEL53275.1 isochorismatase family protein [Goekera deserti]
MVDPVRAYVDPASALYAGVEDAVGGMVELLAVARAAGVPVVFTQVVYRADGADGGVFWRKVPALAANFTEGNPMGAFIPGVEPQPGETVLVKKYPSAFFGTPLAPMLTALGVDTVVIGGLSTSGCVRATATDAMSHGFLPLVVEDAVGDRHEAPHRANLFDLAAKVGEVRPLAAVREWLQTLTPPGGDRS